MRYIALLLLLLLVCVAPAHGFTAGGDQRVDLWVEKEKARKGWVGLAPELARLRLANEELREIDAFDALAQLRWRDELRAVAAETVPLALRHPEGTPARWWTGGGHVARERGSGAEGYRIALAAPEYPTRWSRLEDYAALWVDYRPAPGVDVCAVTVEIGGEARPWRGREKETFYWLARHGRHGGGAMTTTLVAEAADAVWRAKDYRYLLGRFLGRSADDDWRTARDGDNVVVQRRMHWPVREGTALVIELAPDTEPVGINLFMRREDKEGGGELVPVGAPPPGWLPGGGYGVVIDLGRLAAQRFPSEMRRVDRDEEPPPLAWLQEVFLFLPGSEAEIAAAKPVRRLLLREPAISPSRGGHIGGTTTVERVAVERDAWRAGVETYAAGQRPVAADEAEWRIERGDDEITVRRRTDWRVGSEHLLVVELAPGIAPASVRLALGREGKTEATETIMITAPESGSLADGGHGVMIDLGELIRRHLERGDGREGYLSRWFRKEDAAGEAQVPVLLREVTLGFPRGFEGALLSARPVRGISLRMGGERVWQQTVNVRDKIDMSARVESVGGDWQRLALDLGPLARLGRLAWEDGAIRLAAPDPEAPCAVELGDIRLVSGYQGKVPYYMNEIGQWSRRFGGPWLGGVPAFDAVEGVDFVAYAALDGWQPIDPARLGHETVIRVGPESPATVETSPLATGRPTASVAALPAPARVGWQTPGGLVTLAEDGRRVRILSNDAEAVAGEAGGFTLEWAVRGELPEGTRFFLSVPEGGERLGTVTLRLHEVGGGVVEQLVEVNRASSISGLPMRVERVEVRFEPDRYPYRLTLGEMALFVPAVLDHRQALAAPYPWQGEQTPDLRSTGDGLLALDDRYGKGVGFFRIAGATSGTVAMTLNQPLRALERLALSWTMPPEWLGADGCIAGAEFVFDRGSVERRICFHRAAGERDFSAADLGLLDTGALGRLREVVWHFDKPAGGEGVLALGAVVQGRDMLSVRERLAVTPLLKVAGKPLALGGEAITAVEERLADRRFWVPLPEGLLRDWLVDGRPLQVLEDNPWVTVQRISAQPKAPMEWREWIELAGPPPKVRRGFDWGRLLKPLLLLAVVGVVWRLGWWPAIGRWCAGQAQRWLWRGPRELSAAVAGLLWRAAVGYLPGLRRPAAFLARHRLAAWAVCWAAVTAGLYGVGLWMPVSGHGENYYFTFGGMAAVAACWCAARALRPWLERWLPAVAEKVYGGAGSLFFGIALALLVGTALLLVLKLEPVAEQLAIMVYYCLVAGTVLEIIALRRKGREEGAVSEEPFRL